METMKNKHVKTDTGGGGPAEPVLSKAWAGCRTTKMRKALSAFTMAEILLSLTIIGVVAAITLPSLTGNINERTWNTQRKALYARFSQAIALMPALNGYGTLTEGASGNIEDTAAETFVTDGLAKVLKINNICDSGHLSDCGLPDNYTTLEGSKKPFPTNMTALNSKLTTVDVTTSTSVSKRYSYSQLNTNAAAFETVNGESIAVYYNPTCAPDMQETGIVYMPSKICAHFVYDLNGTKGPNTIGKDMGFLTAIYPTDSIVVSPMPYPTDASESIAYDEVAKACTKQNPEYRVPSLHELMSMFASAYMIGDDFASGASYQPSTLITIDNALYVYRVALIYGSYEPTLRNQNNYHLRCVKR